MVKTCLAKGTNHLWIKVEKADASKQNIEEFGKMLGEMLSPLGFKVDIESACRDMQRIGTLTVAFSNPEQNTVKIGCGNR